MELVRTRFASSSCGVSAGLLASLRGGLWVDGLDGQEDELEDVQKGKLDPPTDDEGPGSIDESNRQGIGRESEDEDDALVRRIEGSGVPDPRGEGGPSDWDESIDELARRAGVKLP